MYLRLLLGLIVIDNSWKEANERQQSLLRARCGPVNVKVAMNVLSGFDAGMDEPFQLMYDAVMEEFPNAKLLALG